jgi:hypothetical protein
LPAEGYSRNGLCTTLNLISIFLFHTEIDLRKFCKKELETEGISCFQCGLRKFCKKELEAELEYLVFNAG